jgi:hypothetical protein
MSLDEEYQDLRLKKWEQAALAAASIFMLFSAYMLITDTSIRSFLWPTSSDQAYSRPIGTVNMVFNNTLRQAYNRPEFLPLKQNDYVYPMDTVMSGPSSAIKLTLRDGTVIELGENSMIRLNFDSALMFAGINRRTVIEVVTGTVASVASKTAPITVKSKDKIFQATNEKPILVSRKGVELAPKPEQINIVSRVKERVEKEAAQLEAVKKAGKQPPQKTLAEIARMYEDLGGVMTTNPTEQAKETETTGTTTLADMYEKIKKQKEAVTPQAGYKAIGGGTTGGEPVVERKELTRADISMNVKEAEEMLGMVGRRIRVRTEQAKIYDVSPTDNFTVDQPNQPVRFRWKSNPERMRFTVKYLHDGVLEGTDNVKTDDEDVDYEHTFKKPGHYVWRVEDPGGCILSIRHLFVKAKPEIVELYDPILVGRERGTKLWLANEFWAFHFRWKPVKNAKDYILRVTRNGDTAEPLIAERVTTKDFFILPFRKTWSAERMFFNVEARKTDGSKAYSKVVPFMFTFLPPRPRLPNNRATIARTDLIEGAVPLNWEATSDIDTFTFEVARDTEFKHILGSETIGANTYRFYPGSSGTFFWHVKGEKDGISSPYSEFWEFNVK